MKNKTLYIILFIYSKDKLDVILDKLEKKQIYFLELLIEGL